MNTEISGAKANEIGEPGDALANFRWLADAPLFIDEDQIARFYDAVVRPPYQEGPIKLTITAEKAEEIQRTYNLGGSLTQSLLGEVNPFFAGLKPTLKAGYQRRGKQSTREQDAREITLSERKDALMTGRLSVLGPSGNWKRRAFETSRTLPSLGWQT